MDLPDDEASALYSNADVSDYKPQLVDPVLLHNESIQPSWCYLLDDEKIGTEKNKAYAEKLSALVLKLEFPEAYAHEIFDK
jgi:hypothetical protein